MKVPTYVMAALIIAASACGDDDSQDSVDAGTQPGSSAKHMVERTDIVSDQSGALATDPTLVNAWGLSFNPAGVAWVSSTDQGLSEVYDAQGQAVLPAVKMPTLVGAQPAAPTGQVFNSDQQAFQGDAFIFVTEGGTIAGWQPSDGEQAVLRVDNSTADASYKGVAIAKDTQGRLRLFAADFHGGKIDVFDDSYGSVDTSGGFEDSDLPSGYAPFNVQEVKGSLIVTYAKQDADKADDVAGKGNGFVNMFDADGKLTGRLASKGELNSPWGVALAPKAFAAAPDRLLIGNFGDGLAHVYALNMPSSGSPSATLEGALHDQDGKVLSIDGLWALRFGVDAGGFDANTLYFTAGPDDEQHGVFGKLVPAATSGAPSDAGVRDGGATDAGVTGTGGYGGATGG